MKEQHLRVTRTARFHTLGEPGPAARELWLVCHGYAQLARYFLRAFEPLADGSRFIVAPEALNRYYQESAPGVHARDARVLATWMTREDRAAEIEDYVAYLDALCDHALARFPDTAAPAVVALGFSQGAATVSRWAALGAARIDHVILWGSGPAADLIPAPQLFRGARLTIAIGDADEHISAERVAREDRRLRAAGIDYELIRYAGGHRVEAEPLRIIAAGLRTRR